MANQPLPSQNMLTNNIYNCITISDELHCICFHSLCWYYKHY